MTLKERVISPMLVFLPKLPLEKGLIAGIMVLLVLLVRKMINERSFRYSAMILWSIIALYLFSPYSITFKISPGSLKGAYGTILKFFFYFRHGLRAPIFTLSEAFPKISRLAAAATILLYMAYQFRKTNLALSGAELLQGHEAIEDYVASFHMKRKVSVLINDQIPIPVTYGLFHPKIILQSSLFHDENLLRYVMLHELTHIKRFDMLWIHIKVLIASIYWYNPFLWIATKYIDRDIEILCDKLVLEKAGDCPSVRKGYSQSMLKLTEMNQLKTPQLNLQLHPTVERIRIMKNWKVSLAGVLVFLLTVITLSTSFATFEEDLLPRSNPSNQEERIPFNDRQRSFEITEEEYQDLELSDLQAEELRAADIDLDDSMAAYGNQQYSFNMNNWYGAQHNAFVTKITNTACADGVAYSVNIYENGRKIYSHYANRDLTITTTQTHPTSSYKVVIVNNSGAEFSYHIKLNSYINH